MQHFYGYGSWDASIWYVAWEEGGGELPEEVADKLNYFDSRHGSATRATLCDIRELYREVSFDVEGPKSGLFKTLYDYRFAHNATLHGVWKNLIAFTHGYKNEPLPDLLSYQKETFASSSLQREALIKFYPLPSPHSHAWYYSWLDMPNMKFLKSRELYQHYLYQKRIETILQHIGKYKPELVLMYGMNNINLLKESVLTVFRSAKFRMVKAIPRVIPQHHRADFDGTTLVITTQIPALRHNRIETGFDWETFGKNVRG